MLCSLWITYHKVMELPAVSYPFPLITALHAVELYSHVFAAAQCLCEFPKMPYFTYLNGSIFGKRYLLAIDHIMSTYYFIFGT